jgi:hypothetical protein
VANIGINALLIIVDIIFFLAPSLTSTKGMADTLLGKAGLYRYTLLLYYRYTVYDTYTGIFAICGIKV